MHKAADAGLGLDHDLPGSLCRRLHDTFIKLSHSQEVNWYLNACHPGIVTFTA